jgi:predicted regulator of Ras-like GTPase activity (Roadblock/LC7/MglB family)
VGPEPDIPIPLEILLAQLPRGVIKLQFGDLRRTAPDLFSPRDDLDQVWVTLPLAEIMARLDPALMPRHRPARRLEIPENMPAPFGPQGAEPFPVEPPEAPPTPAFPAPPLAAETRVPSAPETKPANRSPHSLFGQGAQKIPLNVSVPDAPPSRPQSNGSALSERGAPSVPISDPLPERPVPFSPPPVAASPVPAPVAAAIALPSVAPTPSPAKPGEGPAATLTAGVPVLRISLAKLLPGWTEAICQEAAYLKMNESELVLPLEVAEQGLKRGHLAFSWKTIRGWVSPPVPPADSDHDGLPLILPLSVVAPIFLATQGRTAKTRKLVLDESIPELFRPTLPPAPPEIQPPPPADANPAAPADSTTPVAPPPVNPQAADTAKAGNTVLTPDQLVFQATALNGVSGALVVLRDGLPVAERLPSGVNADQLAGFVPQLYNKVGDNLGDFHLGKLTRLRFNVDEVPWEIIRVENAFFAAFGRTGEAFPEENLVTLARRLNGSH